MKKQALLILGLIVILFLSINSKKADVSIEGKKVLFVANAPEGNPLPEDKITIDHLKAMKLDVTVKAAKDTKSEDALAFDLTYVSESVSSARVAKKFNNTTKPVMLSEHFVSDKFGFSGADKDKDYGQTEMKYKEIKIFERNKKHPLAADFNGVVVVYKENGKFGFTVPQGQVKIIATLPDDPKKAVIYAFDKGALNMTREKVPARRVFFYLSQGQEANQTEAGWKLFDAAINWALGLNK